MDEKNGIDQEEVKSGENTKTRLLGHSCRRQRMEFRKANKKLSFFAQRSGPGKKLQEPG